MPCRKSGTPVTWEAKAEPRAAQRGRAGVGDGGPAGQYGPFRVRTGREWGGPNVNVFGLWWMVNVYMRYHDQMDAARKADCQWLFTHNTSWAGSTGNLSFLIPLNLYLTEKIWDPRLLPADGRYGARGPDAVKMFVKRIAYTVSRG